MNDHLYDTNIQVFTGHDGTEDFVGVMVCKSGTVLLRAETQDSDGNTENTLVAIHPDALRLVIVALQDAAAHAEGTLTHRTADHPQPIGTFVHPSFYTHHHRDPVAGQDYDREATMSGDDYAYYICNTPYTRDLPSSLTIPTVHELRQAELYNLDALPDWHEDTDEDRLEREINDERNWAEKLSILEAEDSSPSAEMWSPKVQAELDGDE